MSEIIITIPGKPQARQAHAVSTRGGFVRKYLLPESASYQNLVKLECKRVMKNRQPIQGAVSVEYLFVFQAPKSLKKSQRQAVERGEFIVHETRGQDICNLLKSVNDGLKGIAIEDDGLIIDAGFSKRYGLKPCTVVTIRKVEA